MFSFVLWSPVKKSLAVRINDTSWRPVIFFTIQLKKRVCWSGHYARSLYVWKSNHSCNVGQKEKRQYGHVIPNNLSYNIRYICGFPNCGIFSCSSFRLLTDRELIHYNRNQTYMPGITVNHRYLTTSLFRRFTYHLFGHCFIGYSIYHHHNNFIYIRQLLINNIK